MNAIAEQLPTVVDRINAATIAVCELADQLAQIAIDVEALTTAAPAPVLAIVAPPADPDGLPLATSGPGLRGARDAIDTLGEATSRQVGDHLGITRSTAEQTLRALSRDPWRIVIACGMEETGRPGRRPLIWRRRRRDDPVDPLELARVGPIGRTRLDGLELLRASGPMRSSDLRRALGVSKSTLSHAMLAAAAAGECASYTRGRERWYAIERPDTLEQQPPDAPAESPVAAGDQYATRPIDDLIVMCVERGIEIAENASPDEVRQALRNFTGGTTEPDSVTAVRGRRPKAGQPTDEELRRRSIEQKILKLCSDAPLTPRAVAVNLVRNQAEIRALMIELAHRGLLRSRDGLSTFEAVTA